MSDKIMKRRRFPGPGGSGAYEPSSIISGDFEQQSHPSDTIPSIMQPDEELSSQGYARSDGRIMIDSPSRRERGLAKAKANNGNFSEDENTDDFQEVSVSPEMKTSTTSIPEGDGPQHADNANDENDDNGIGIGDDDNTNTNTSTNTNTNTNTNAATTRHAKTLATVKEASFRKSPSGASRSTVCIWNRQDSISSNSSFNIFPRE